MFHRIFLTSSLLVGVFFAPYLASAQSYGLKETVGKTGYSTTMSVESSIETVVSSFLGIVAILFFILVTYAGLRWMTARGNEEFVLKAKGTLETGLIGLVVVMLAYAITAFIFSKIEAVQSPVGGQQSPPAEEIPLVACTNYTSQAVCDADETCVWNGVCLER